MDGILIRPAVPADVPAITAIYAPAVINGTASFELEAPDETEMGHRFQSIVDAGFPYLAAERAGRVVGYAYANLYRTRPAYRFTVEDSIYVAQDQHGQGIGKLLLAELLVASEQRGFRQMIAVIGDSMQFGSIALHRSAGFTFCGTLHSVGFKFGRWIDSVLMQKAIGEGDTSPAR